MPPQPLVTAQPWDTWDSASHDDWTDGSKSYASGARSRPTRAAWRNRKTDVTFDGETWDGEDGKDTSVRDRIAAPRDDEKACYAQLKSLKGAGGALAAESGKRLNEQLKAIQNDIRTSRPARARLTQLQKRQTECIRQRDEIQVELADANTSLVKAIQHVQHCQSKLDEAED